MPGAQINMFDAGPVAAPAAKEFSDGLRSYQENAVSSAAKELKLVRATMLVMATGSGKTRTATAFIRRWLNGSISF